MNSEISEKFQILLNNLKALNLPPEEFVIVSSGSLAVRGIREAKDLDVVVTEKLWNELVKNYPIIEKDGVQRIDCGNYIEILENRSSLFANSHVVPVEDVFRDADVIDGIKYISLNHLRKIKETFKREKDIKDIALIDAYLNR